MVNVIARLTYYISGLSTWSFNAALADTEPGCSKGQEKFLDMQIEHEV